MQIFYIFFVTLNNLLHLGIKNKWICFVLLSIFRNFATMMTNNWIILACALIPAIALLVFVYKQDKRPEPVRLIAKGFLLGVLSVIPISIVEAMLMMAGAGTNMPTTLLGAIFTAFIVAAIPEEGIKLLMLNMLLRRNKFFDEHYDGIVYAVSVSMGFAAVENVSYLFGNVDMWQQVGISRALLAVPAHYAFAVLMGYYYSLYRFSRPRNERYRVMILAAPVIAHGIYDTIAFSIDIQPALGGVLYIVLIWFCFRLHKICLQRIREHVQRDNAVGQ